MKMISMLEFRRNSEAVVESLRCGQSLTLTYRGKPLARLLPIAPADEEITADDPFYKIAELAEAGDDNAKSISNAEIDQILYGQP